MCRLLGVVSSRVRSFDRVLSEAPRSLAVLSEAHRDGWGIAASRRGASWQLERNTLMAGRDPRFLELARATLGDVIIAHVRQRTRGALSIENTHPFSESGWVFAHNGTVEDVAFLERETSRCRAAQVAGETDSERLFAYLLTRFDEAGVMAQSGTSGIDRVLLRATQALRARPGLGTASFLLSNGSVLYAHRFGRALYLLRRDQSGLGCVSCSPEHACVAVSSEPMTAEPWVELPNGGMARLDHDPEPRWRRLVLLP